MLSAADLATYRRDGFIVLPEIIAALVRADVRVRAVEPVRQTLEQIYLSTVAPAP